MRTKAHRTYTDTDLKTVFIILVHRVYPAYNVSAWKNSGNTATVNITAGDKKYKAVPVNFTLSEDGFMFEIFISADDKRELHLTETEFYRLVCDIHHGRIDEINRYMQQYTNDKEDLFYC